MNSSKLTVLVPSTAYTLAYTLPLLLISILLIFAGSFLTLDRTRSFPPSEEYYSSLPGTFDGNTKKRKLSWRLEGGVGGLAIGYAFGVHLSTLLALLIPAKTSSSPLAPKSFIAVWVLCCIPTTALGGLKRHAALVFAGIGGGIAISLGLSIIVHPSLLPRQILIGVFTVLLTTLLLVASLIPQATFLLRPTLRIASSSLGSLGLVISIALLSPKRVMGWANAWERIWLPNGDPAEWGTGQEKGLSAAWAVFWVLGIASDWALRRWVGECPDEKWDSYLSKFVSDPPNRPDRAGDFRPLQSWWDRHINTKPRSKADDLDSIIFPAEKGSNSAFPKPPDGLPEALYSVPPPKPVSPKFKKNLRKNSTRTQEAHLDEEIDVPDGAAFLRKKTSSKEGWKRRLERKRKKPIKFGAIDELSSSDSGEDDDERREKGGSDLVLKLGVDVDEKDRNEKKVHQSKRPLVVANPPSYSSDVSSAPTLVDGRRTASRTPITPTSKAQKPWDEHVEIDYDKELERLQARLGSRELPTYSDDEDSRGAPRTKKSSNASVPIEAPSSNWTPAFLQQHQDQGTRSRDLDSKDADARIPRVPMVVPPIPGAVPMPATPSLIRAIDRIAIAQKDAFGIESPGVHPLPHDLESGIAENWSGKERREPSPKRWDDFWREVKMKAQD